MNPDANVQLGMTASVQVSRRLKAAAIRLPLTALTEQNSQAAVWVVDPQTLKVTRHTVQLGEFHGDQVIIANGLVSGQRVVVAGVHKLYPEQQVRLLDDAP